MTERASLFKRLKTPAKRSSPRRSALRIAAPSRMACRKRERLKRNSLSVRRLRRARTSRLSSPPKATSPWSASGKRLNRFEQFFQEGRLVASAAELPRQLQNHLQLSPRIERE